MAVFEIGVGDTRKIIKVIFEKHHIDLSEYSVISLKRRFEKIIQLYNFKNSDLLIDRIMMDNRFIEDLLTNIAVESTEMFRDPSFWKYLKNDFLPIELTRTDKLKVFIPFSVSGDELYSLCILLKEEGWLQHIDITASCLTSKLIQNIKSGLFKPSKLEVSKENYKAMSGRSSLNDYISTQNDCIYRDTGLISDVSFIKTEIGFPRFIS